METILAQVDVLRLLRMKFHALFLRLKKEVLDFAHFIPCRYPGVMIWLHAHVVPASSVGGDDVKPAVGALEADAKYPVVAFIFPVERNG